MMTVTNRLVLRAETIGVKSRVQTCSSIVLSMPVMA